MLDQIDKDLLALLQTDAHMTSQDLSARLNLSASQVGRRRQRLEAEGFIRAYTARLDPLRLGLAIQAFIQVQMSAHGAAEGRDFARLVRLQPEIVSVWTLTGEADYLLRAYCPDLAALNRLVHDILLASPLVSRVQSQIVMNQLKPDAALPL